MWTPVRTYVAFLRAINLGQTRKYPKDETVRTTESAGFAHVFAHGNTGNLRFQTTLRSRARIEAALEQAYLADRGFEVPTIVFEAEEFAEVAAQAERLGSGRELARHYVYLLKAELDEETAARVEACSTDAGEMVVRGRAVHALLGPGYQQGKVDPLNAAKLLGAATNRNVNVVRTLAAKWC